MSAVPKATPGTSNPYAPPRARVRDVAAPTAALVPAERSTRLGAAIVDGLIFFAMVYIPMLGGMVLDFGGTPAGEEPGGTLMLIGMLLALVGLVAFLWLTLKQMNDTGQSLAKKYFEIKVVRSDGSPASLGTLVWKRNVLNWLISIVPGYSVIELLFIFREDRQCLHDKIADTIVVQA